ncbi:MAG: hypothetical protein AB1817_12885 [Chloroflexota bacterium]
MKDETISASVETIDNEVAAFEIKYGVNYEQFIAKLDRGEYGNPFAYELEQDAMEWESLSAEKRMWLEQLHRLEE